MLLTHWLTLFERDWQFALDVKTSRTGHPSSPWFLHRGKHRPAGKNHLPPVLSTQPAKLPYHLKACRRQCSST